MSVLEPSTVERYEDLPSATSSSTGAVSIALQQVPVGTRCVFTVSVPNSPPLASWTIAKGLTGAAQTLMSWAGPTPVGPFTIDGPERLIVTGSGLASLVPYQTIALGKRGPASLIDPEVPTGPAQFTVPTGGPPTVLGVFGYTAPGPSTFTIPTLPTGLRAITVAINQNGNLQLSASGQNSFYFFGEIPTITAPGPDSGQLASTFAINPNETTLNVTLSGGTGAGSMTVLGSFVDRAFSLTPPLGMPPSASQLTSQSAIAPGLDRALWMARADVPRFTASIAFAATANLIAAPGAGLRNKLYYCVATDEAGTAANITLTGASFHVNKAAGNWTVPFDFHGFEMGANTALVATVAAGTARFTITYDIVPA